MTVIPKQNYMFPPQIQASSKPKFSGINSDSESEENNRRKNKKKHKRKKKSTESSVSKEP